MKEYKIIPKRIKYGIRPYPLAQYLKVDFPGHNVEIANDKGYAVVLTKSGWHFVDKEGNRFSKSTSGAGNYGFGTPEEAIENYLTRQTKINPAHYPKFRSHQETIMQSFNEGDIIWFLSGKFANEPLKGKIDRITDIDGIKTYWIKTDIGEYRASKDIMFDHKPRKTDIVDMFGSTKIWMNPKYRKGHVGNWVLLGKIYTKRANCHLCGKELHGGQLIYTHLTTKEKIAVCQLCVRKFENNNSTNPVKRSLTVMIHRTNAYGDPTPEGIYHNVSGINEAEKIIKEAVSEFKKHENWKLHLINVYNESNQEIYRWDAYISKDSPHIPFAKRSNPLKHPSETDKAELINLYHLARVAGKNTRYDRMQWAVSQFVKEHPEWTKTSAYIALDRIGQNPVASNLYQDFHGNSPMKKVKVYYEAPENEEIVKIGRLVRIDYTPESNSQHEGTHFTHEAGDLGHKTIKSNAILATNKSGTQLYIVKEKKGKYPKFSERGILG